MDVVFLIWIISLALILLETVILAGLVGRRLIGWLSLPRKGREHRDACRLIRSYLAGELGACEVQRRVSAELLIKQAVRRAGTSTDAQRARLRCLATGLNAHQLRPMLQARTRRKRLRAVYLLSFFTSPEVAQALESTLHTDPEGDVRLAAAKALAQMDRLPFLPTVLDALGDKIQEGSRIVYGIARNLPADRIGELESLFQSQDWRQRLVAVDALGHAMAPRSDILEQALDDSHLEVRTAALRAIGRRNLRQAAPGVMAKLDDPAWPVRCQAARSAGILRIEAALPRLREMLSEKNWWVRFRAAESILALGPRGRDVLAACAARKDDAGDVASLVLMEQGMAE
ncbi:MAG: HEAT repeat domain-containing protein [Wenzhouxiangellaceae bacterium]|nr:HEAT repeat domain-containing protein [Wenzhouxiangellaceae bacterium]